MMTKSLGMLVLLLISLFSIAIAQPTSSSGKKLIFSENACIDFFKLGWDNWRVLVILGLLITVAIISLFYMGGEMLRDSSVVARAKDDMFQMVATSMIVLIIFSIVSIMCNDTISDVLLFKDKNLFEAAGSYLTNAADWTFHETVYAGLGFWGLNMFESFLDSFKTSIPEGFAESFGLFYDQAIVFFMVPFFAYISMLLQMQMLYFVQPFALSILIPIGIILRGFAPFRSFGGGLLGVGISLLVFFPMLIALDAVFIDSYFSNNKHSTDLMCNSNQECISKVCPSEQSWTVVKTGLEKESIIVPKTIFGKSACAEQRKTGEACGEDSKVDGGWQCLSGRCDNGKCKDATALNNEGGICTSDTYCKNGLWCDKIDSSGVCKGPKLPWYGVDEKSSDSQCTENSQCGLAGRAFCSKKEGVCMPTVSPGVACQDDVECASIWCKKPENICSEGKMTETDIQYDLLKARSSNNPVSALNIGATFGNMVNFFTLSIIAGFVLPLINLVVIGRAMKDISGFLGSEIDLAKIYQVL